MKRLLATTILPAAIGLAGLPAAHASSPVPTSAAHVSGSFTGEGSWGGGLGSVPTHTTIALHGTFAGSSSVHGTAVVGTMLCDASGSGTESLPGGAGSLTIACRGDGQTLYVDATYGRTGTVLVASGTGRLVTWDVNGVLGSSQAQLPVSFTIEVTPSSLPPGSVVRFFAEGTVVGATA